MDSDEKWFARASSGVSAVTRYSRVGFFVDAEEYYTDLRKEVEASGEGGFICWIGFDAGGWEQNTVTPTPMPVSAATFDRKPFARRSPSPGDRSWYDVLASAANERGVLIRALLNLHPAPRPTNRHKWGNLDLVTKLNALPKALAINDFRYLWLNGTHHQKLVIVLNKRGLSAYVGTMDVHFQRIAHRWCEVHCKFRGDAAQELYRVFWDRYIEHKEIERRVGTNYFYLLPSPNQVPAQSGGGRVLAQVATTYGNPQRPNPIGIAGPKTQVVNQPHRVQVSTGTWPVPGTLRSWTSPPVEVGNDFFLGKDPEAPMLLGEASRQTPTYAFAPRGSTGIYAMIKAAIENTKEFIYLEDQYLICDQPMGQLRSVLDLLVDKVKQNPFKKLIILCTRLDEINEEHQGLAAPHRRQFVERLASAGGPKVVICQYKSNEALGTGIGPARHSPFYIHSKTWIFDDQYLVTGSANCNRRGYSHDSELDVGVYDVERQFVKELRIRIWLSRLNTEKVRTLISRADMVDPLAGAKYWEHPSRYGLIIENHRIGIDTFVPNSTSPPVIIDSQGYGPAVDLVALAGATRDRLFWDIAVDPDGS